MSNFKLVIIICKCFDALNHYKIYNIIYMYFKTDNVFYVVSPKIVTSQGTLLFYYYQIVRDSEKICKNIIQ